MFISPVICIIPPYQVDYHLPCIYDEVDDDHKVQHEHNLGREQPAFNRPLGLDLRQNYRAAQEQESVLDCTHTAKT